MKKLPLSTTIAGCPRFPHPLSSPGERHPQSGIGRVGDHLGLRFYGSSHMIDLLNVLTRLNDNDVPGLSEVLLLNADTLSGNGFG